MVSAFMSVASLICLYDIVACVFASLNDRTHNSATFCEYLSSIAVVRTG
jgi:hypothetical protein